MIPARHFLVGTFRCWCPAWCDPRVHCYEDGALGRHSAMANVLAGKAASLLLLVYENY